MSKECCLTGFTWDGTPSGGEGTLGDNPGYISGSNPDVAIMVIHDAFGWTFNNERLLCDHYAKEVGATVYMPDFFSGEVLDPEILGNHDRWGEFDFAGFHKRTAKEVREPEIFACVRALRQQHDYKRVGVLGYCFGGWSSFRCGSRSHNPPLVDCISTAHPTFLTKEEMDDIGVPAQILAPEKDIMFTEELKRYVNEVIPAKGVPYEYIFFPGVVHGFATRGNPNVAGERAAMARGKRAMVNWMKEWLHGDGKW